MPKITAIIHTKNDARRIGRALESLRPCDEVIVVDHGSDDDTPKIAREHGANLKLAVPGVSPGTYLVDAKNDWILTLLPNESLTEALEASLFEWKDKDPDSAFGFSVEVREECKEGWKSMGPQTRLVNRTKVNWISDLPPNEPDAGKLAGDLLRFHTP
jgi:glycosyltransferase involved in cell wall biosynthesis